LAGLGRVEDAAASADEAMKSDDPQIRELAKSMREQIRYQAKFVGA
jgi:hypothetical protein